MRNKNSKIAASYNTPNFEEKMKDVPSFSASEGEIEDLMETIIKKHRPPED